MSGVFFADPTTRRTSKPRGGAFEMAKYLKSRLVSVQEAVGLLNVSQATVHRLGQSGALRGRLIERPRRRWTFQLTDVLRMRSDGTALRQRHAPVVRKERAAWERHFGTIPAGYIVVPRNGDREDVSPENLCLVAAKSRCKNPGPKIPRQRRFRWTRASIAELRRRYSSEPTEELAREFGASSHTVRIRARRLGLRKARAYLTERAKTGKRLPLGTERVKESDFIWIKAAFDGPYRKQWRPKHHVIWEQVHGRSVPVGFCVMFKDGNKRNFHPSNLELTTRREAAAIGFANYIAYPESLQAAIRVNKKLQREVRRQLVGGDEHRPARRAMRRRRGLTPWTQQMDRVLYRDYPRKPIQELISALGVSEPALRNRAKRLRIRRLPETILAEARAAAAVQKSHALSRS